jgi:SprT protein
MATNILSPQEVSSELQRLAAKKIKQCLSIARRKIKKDLPYEGVKFFHKSTDAGYVIASENNCVYLNHDLFRKNKKRFLDEIIPHEVAHLVAEALSPRESPHGGTWKIVMQSVFSLKPERCHSMETKGIGRTTQKFLYICACQKHEVGIIRHNKVQSGKKFRCVKCKKELVFLRKVKQ